VDVVAQLLSWARLRLSYRRGTAARFLTVLPTAARIFMVSKLSYISQPDDTVVWTRTTVSSTSSISRAVTCPIPHTVLQSHGRCQLMLDTLAVPVRSVQLLWNTTRQALCCLHPMAPTNLSTCCERSSTATAHGTAAMRGRLGSESRGNMSRR
jgi:hypothetical protein